MGQELDRGAQKLADPVVQAFTIPLFARASSFFIMASIVRLDMFPAIVAYSIVPFLDGPALCAWKAVGRISDQYETRMQIGLWLFRRGLRMQQLGRRFLYDRGRFALHGPGEEASDSEL